MSEAKFEKRILCPNCNEFRTYRFPRGTDLRGRKIECDNCGVLILGAPAAAPPEKQPCGYRRDDRWSFMRDFFGLKDRP